MIKIPFAKFDQPVTGFDGPENSRIGRNDPCPCGSGKKFKACCVQAGGAIKQTKSTEIASLLQNARLAISRGDFDSAERWFRQVLLIKPNHAEALAGVGQKLCWQRKRREGLTYLLQAARQVEKECVKSRDIAQLLELSGQLQHWGDLEAALKLAQLAVRLAPSRRPHTIRWQCVLVVSIVLMKHCGLLIKLVNYCRMIRVAIPCWLSWMPGKGDWTRLAQDSSGLPEIIISQR